MAEPLGDSSIPDASPGVGAYAQDNEVTPGLDRRVADGGRGSNVATSQLPPVPSSLDSDVSFEDSDWILPAGLFDDMDAPGNSHATDHSSWLTQEQTVPATSAENANHLAVSAICPRELASWPGHAGPATTSGEGGTNRRLHTRLSGANSMPPKIGSRFSRESARVLKQWLNNHEEYPYPSHADKQSLQALTGLTTTQITNWLANARRRQKAANNRRLPPSDQPSTSVFVRPSTPMPIPHGRSRTSHDDMNPFQRWVDSPPEDEAAAVDDIARAISSRRPLLQKSSGEDYYVDHSSGPSSVVGDSSASSVGSSRAGLPSGAASSQGSFRSRGSTSPLPIPRRRRRARKADHRTPLLQKRGPYQCTFCTETFRSKYDWQRHEKSLHIPLERWTCSPDGPTSVNPATENVCCVFCGEVEPSLGHVARHNFNACQERVFNRRDHLKQHLRLVHDTEGVDWAVASWKVSSPDVKSRCGFCGKDMMTFSERADHISDHFKTGQTMADWTGDWGFEQWVLDSLENFIPPYINELERTSPFPFTASHPCPYSPRTAYELITLELAFFIQRHLDGTGQTPTNRQLQLEACRIIFASEVLSSEKQTQDPESASWLRDLITFDSEITQQAKFGRIRSQEESRLSSLRINGKRTLFDSCPLEMQLRDHFLTLRSSSSAVAIDNALQLEAFKVIARMEQSLPVDSVSDFVANWLAKLVMTSTGWLARFQERARLPLKPQSDPPPIQGVRQGFQDLTDAASFMSEQPELVQKPGPSSNPVQDRIPDTDTELDYLQQQQQQQQGLVDPSLLTLDATESYQAGDETRSFTTYPFTATSPSSFAADFVEASGTFASMQSGLDSNTRSAWLRSGQFILNNSSSHRWMTSELKRWVIATMSPDNPESHIPSDEEIRNQSRYIVYNDIDPWNTTEADNTEWLAHFKRDAGVP